ncbi:sporulation protein YpjB [Cohnella sp. REN36]|uniref:sporulation protein YpjB n=1 Tax=Cohnella sp. REN36 TaxID=2887347 RepID=UPI001D157A4B|nr:sporulation protein YpjB [Cohnella sp. REN36]MCC3376501.1 sporulation protein YpjB [Cohnella sp. REN36]
MEKRDAIAIRYRKTAGLLLLLLAWVLGAVPAAASAATGEAAGTAGAGKTSAGEPEAAFRSAAEALYLAVQQGEPLTVHRKLQEAEKALRALPMERIPHAEGIAALSGSVADLKRALAATAPDETKIQTAAGALRLAADALASSQRPLWLQYRKLMQEELTTLELSIGAAPGRIPPEAKMAFERLSGHYALIRTAVALEREPSVVERGDSVFRYGTRVMAAKQPDARVLDGLTEPLRDAVEGLFPPGDGEPAAGPLLIPPAWGFAATIGSFIVTVLTYAGWRRFRFERRGGGSGRNGGGERRDAADRWLGR